MIWVELFGLPASGKSTCASALLGALRRRGFIVYGRDEGVRRCLRFRDGLILNAAKTFLPHVRDRINGTDYAMPELCDFASKHPDVVSEVFAAMSRRPLQPRDRRSGLGPAFRTFAEYELATSRLGPNEVIVHDEGIAHRCYTLFGYLDEPVPAAEIANYVRSAPTIDCAVWTDVSPETSEERIERRALGVPRPWLASLPVEDRVACLRRGRDCLSAIAQALSTKGIPLLHVNNELPRAKSEATIEEWVTSIEGKLRGHGLS